MKIFTVHLEKAKCANRTPTARTVDRVTHDKDTFNINASDCGPDCKCGRAHTNQNQERQRLVSDADLKSMPIADVVKLASPITQDQALRMRAFKELHRRQWGGK